MTTATATEATIMNAIETWSAGSCLKTIEESEMTEAVINVQSSDPQAFGEVASVLVAHNANVRSGHGGRMTKIVGVQFYIKAPTDQIGKINDDIAEKFGIVPPVVSREEDFPQVNKWIANYEIKIYVREDRPGVLAEVFNILKDHDVNVVTIRAATGPSIRRSRGPGSLHTYWGQATIGVYIPDVGNAAAVLDALGKNVDKVSVEPLPDDDRPKSVPRRFLFSSNTANIQS
jgi:hypothetical protein